MSTMPTGQTKEWPIIKELNKPKGGAKKTRRFTIQDARNTWEIETIKAEEITFTIQGFSKVYFKFDGDLLRCFKKLVVRPSDSGEVTCFEDDRFNLIDDNGDRKTLRLKSLKKHVLGLFK